MNKILPMLVSLTFALCGAIAGPLTPQHVAADAKWVLHFDADRFRSTLIGRYYTENLLERHAAEGRTKHSFDFGPLLRSLKSATAYGADYDKGAKTGVLLLAADEAAIKGIEDHLAALAEKGKLKRLQSKPFPVFKIEKELVVAPLKGGILLLSKSEENVERAWSVIAGKQASLAKNGALTDFGGGSDDFIFVAAAEAFKRGVSLPAKAKMFRKTESLRLALGERDDRLVLSARLKTEDAEVATQIKQVVEGLLAFVAMEQEEDKDMRVLAKSAKVNATDATVTASFEFPEARVIEHLKKESKKTARK